jgi:hypothetical protein
MRVTTRSVVDGRIELPVEAVAEGVSVVVLAPESNEPVRLTPAEEHELWEAAEQIHRGEYMDAQEILDELRARL